MTVFPVLDSALQFQSGLSEMRKILNSTLIINIGLSLLKSMKLNLQYLLSVHRYYALLLCCRLGREMAHWITWRCSCSRACWWTADVDSCTGGKKECGQSGEDSRSRPAPSGSVQPWLDTSLLYLSSDAAKYSFSYYVIFTFTIGLYSSVQWSECTSENTFFAFSNSGVFKLGSGDPQGATRIIHKNI